MVKNNLGNAQKNVSFLGRLLHPLNNYLASKGEKPCGSTKSDNFSQFQLFQLESKSGHKKVSTFPNLVIKGFWGGKARAIIALTPHISGTVQQKPEQINSHPHFLT